MMDRVAWSIGHGNNTYPPSKGVKFPNGEVFEEHDFNSNVVLEGLELARHNGFEIYLPQKPHSKEIPLRKKIDIINKEHKKSPFLCTMAFHANASKDKKASGKGVFYWYSSSKSKKLADIWHKESKILPIVDWGNGVWTSRPNHWSNMGILRLTDMPAILMEHFFFTNYEELKKCNTKKFIKLAAEVAVRTLCKYAGREFRPLEQVKGVSQILYRVQTGAFENKKNAERLERVLKVKGFDTYIVEEDGLHKVQVGAFSKKENALDMEQKLKSAGFETYIDGLENSNVKTVSKEKPNIKVGSKVKIKKNAKTYEDKRLADYVYYRTYKVTQVKGDRVVVTYKGTVVAAINKKDLILV